MLNQTQKSIFMLFLCLPMTVMRLGAITCSTDNSMWTKSTTGTIASLIIIDGDMEILSGVTITVTGSLLFKSGAKLYVRTGGRLILDGGTLTRSVSSPGVDCPILWGGVVIEGTGTSGQTAYGTYSTNQGMLTMKNDASIQWAELGAQSTEGGIIIAEESYFQNCRVSVEIADYTNPDGAWINNCKFTDCNFFCDSELPGYSTSQDGNTIQAFVRLLEVNGIRFFGNVFKNIVSHSSIYQTSRGKIRGIGIESINSGFFVTRSGPLDYPEELCANPTGLRNKFEGLYMGIYANSFKGKQIVACETYFYNIQKHSLFISGGAGHIIYRCRFEYTTLDYLIPFPNGSASLSYITLSSTGDFKIDSSQFLFELEPTDLVVINSIHVNNSGSGGGNIYSNKFKFSTDINVAGNAILFYFNNPSINIACNDFEDTNFDMQFSTNRTPDTNAPIGEAYFYADQSTAGKSPGNTFTGCSIYAFENPQLAADNGSGDAKKAFIYFETGVCSTSNIGFQSGSSNACSPHDYCDISEIVLNPGE